MILKLLASCLNTLLPDLISKKQTRFVPRRNILDSILIAWMMRVWLAHTRFMALFFMLDYEKAFARVGHGYLWMAMARLGLGNDFICLVKGTITRVASKVHLNGLFSK